MALGGETSLPRGPGKRPMVLRISVLARSSPTLHDVALGTNPER